MGTVGTVVPDGVAISTLWDWGLLSSCWVGEQVGRRADQHHSSLASHHLSWEKFWMWKLEGHHGKAGIKTGSLGYGL